MVYPRAAILEEPTLNEDPPGSTARADFTRYARPLDRRMAGIEGAGDHPAMVPLVFHDAFKRRASMSRADRRELEIKQAALRICAGLELRSLRALGRLIGCSHTAIDNMVGRLCSKLGMRKFHVSDSTREKLRAARRRQLLAKSR